MNQLNYRPNDRFVPDSPGEENLQTVTAEYWLQVHDVQGLHTEGMCFDREGNLWYTVIYGGDVCKVNMETKEITVVYHNDNYKPASVKIHKDGRVFVCCLRKEDVPGRIFYMNPDGTGYTDIIEGYNCDDLAFDDEGGFWFTHMVGDAENPAGCVYHVSPDYKTITPFMPNMAAPNGVALSPSGDALWVTECHRGLLHRVMLNSYKIKNVVNHIPGFFGPDSCEVDGDGNLYVAMCGQGRVLVFNPYGYLIGQIKLPGREIGENLWTTHTQVRPGTREIYIISCDDNGDKGSWIFKAEAYAEADPNSFQYR